MKHILIVDDNAENLYLLRVLLEGNGFEVDEARHGAEALANAGDRLPDLIISDLLMPVMDGYSLLRSWKKNERLRPIPFIVYTATYTDPKDEQLALDLGADAFIIKPSEPQHLMECVSQVMQTKLQSGEAPRVPQIDDIEIQREYSETLIRKLEKRALQLERSNKELKAEIAERQRAETEIERTSELLQAVTDGTTDAVFVKDRDGKYLLFNRAACRFVGKPVEEIIGFDDTVAFPDADATVVMNNDRWVIETGQPRTFEERLKTPSGERIFHALKVPYRDANGDVIGIIGVSRDVTDQKKAEEELRLRDRAIQAVSQGIIITDATDPENPIIYSSAGFERITGFSPDEVLGRNCKFLQGEGSDPATVAEIREAIAQRRPCSLEILNYRKDGTPFWNHLTISPVFDKAGNLANFVGVQEDVTERRLLEEQLRQSQKMEAFGQLAGGVAHDFNNLLIVILGFSERLLRTLPEDDPNRSAVKEINNAGKRAAALTEQMLAFSRQTVLAPKVLDLNAAIRDIVNILRRLIGEDIELEIKLDDSIDHVRVDPSHFGQVLMNLTINARDAMPLGGSLAIETASVTLDGGPNGHPGELEPGEYVVLKVSDTGCGIPPEIASRIFEPFFTTKTVGKGTGLGLAVVHGIVKQSGGDIQVESEADLGTTFKIYFPAVKDEYAEVAVPVEETAPDTANSETILLVEDEESVRAFTVMALEAEGYKVLSAANGREALDIAKENSGGISLMITDVIMPGIDGPKLAELLSETAPNVKVLFISGYTSDAVLRHGLEENSVAFLQKPFTPAQLAARVRSVLDGTPM
jgi:two-component system, cell cycle sensor histidine kinase and response regulator CckA